MTSISLPQFFIFPSSYWFTTMGVVVQMKSIQFMQNCFEYKQDFLCRTQGVGLAFRLTKS
jgi:hypothetical protein